MSNEQIRAEFEAWMHTPVAAEIIDHLLQTNSNWVYTKDFAFANFIAYKAGRASVVVEADPAAWRIFDGEGGYNLIGYEYNETYRDDFIAANPKLAKDWVTPLYDNFAIEDAGGRVR